MGKNATREENEILLMIAERFSCIRAWKSKVVLARLPNGRAVRAGIPGQSDITGIIAPKGRRLEIEVKAGNDTTRRNQERFIEMVNSMGGVAFIAHDADDAERQLIERGVPRDGESRS